MIVKQNFRPSPIRQVLPPGFHCEHILNGSGLLGSGGVPSSGPSGIKIFYPGILRDGILPNPGIPGFFGTGFTPIKSDFF